MKNYFLYFATEFYITQSFFIFLCIVLYSGIISDGIHISPDIVKNFVRNKGWTKIVLTSDLVSDKGLFSEKSIIDTPILAISLVQCSRM